MNDVLAILSVLYDILVSAYYPRATGKSIACGTPAVV